MSRAPQFKAMLARLIRDAAPAASPRPEDYRVVLFGDSHFFSAFADECQAVAERYRGFVLEDAEAFYVLLPDVSSGACAGSSDPVFRMWNGRSDTNHRYTADTDARQAMLAAGWISEGYGPSGVGWCAPRPTLATVD